MLIWLYIDDLKSEIKGTNELLDRSYHQKEQYRREKITRALTDQQQRCHRAFKVTSYAEQKDINPRPAEGTCQWALQSLEYVRWVESCCNDLLWLSADPGCGKSVLAKSIIDDYLQASSSRVTICYFFFKDNDEQNNLATAICSLLHQLFSQRPHLLHHAFLSWEKNGKKLRYEVDELWQIFITATSAEASCKTICVLDALDECREIDQGRLAEKLGYFHYQPCISPQDTWLKFLITSRPYDRIQHRLRAITDSFPHLHLRGEEANDQIRREIDLVVKSRVKELATTALLSYDVQQRLEQQLLQMEHRTYLWLHLAMDDIQITFESSLRPAKESIRLIPPSVNAAYEKILSRVPYNQVNTVRTILKIIVAARRPLTTNEMAMALGIATCPRARNAVQAAINPVHLDKKLRGLCGLFVFTNNSKIYLIHQTAREFLIREKVDNYPISAYSFRLKDTEDQMAHICLRYLSMVCFEKDESQTFPDLLKFLEYSAVYWPDHVRNMTPNPEREVNDLLYTLYKSTARQFSLWFPKFWGAMMPYQEMPKMEAIHLAAFNGHRQVVHRLLAEGDSNLNVADTTGSYPVAWASLNGHPEIVQLMLSRGAKVNALGGSYGNALQAACLRGNQKIAQALLEHGADANAQGGEYGNALEAASYEGHARVVEMLLDQGADVNAQCGKYGNALQAASCAGHEKVVQMLLDRGADVNAQGGKYGNALQAASYESHENVVEILLDQGADINAYGGFYGNALTDASYTGHARVAEMLLDQGADVNAQGGKYGNALQAASCAGHEEVVQMLLDRGADVNAQGGKYGNALQAASYRGHRQVVTMLLNRGADVNAYGGEYGNALSAASFWGHEKVVQMLLDQAVDVGAQGGKYGNAIQAASFRGHKKVAKGCYQYIEVPM